MTKFTYEVEWMSRPDERDHVRNFGDNYKGACDFARRMSDRHDGSAYVVAYREVGHGATARIEAVGHVIYVFGNREEVEGELKAAA